MPIHNQVRSLDNTIAVGKPPGMTVSEPHRLASTVVPRSLGRIGDRSDHRPLADPNRAFETTKT